LRKNHGKEEQRARDLFYGLWIPDLFMRRVKENKDWTLFCPNEAFDDATGKGLIDLWGKDFEQLYERMESSGKGRKQQVQPTKFGNNPLFKSVHRDH